MRDTETRINQLPVLTIGMLQKLLDSGFQYAQVRGINAERETDYFSPEYLLLLPMKNLPEDPSKMDIYTALDSQIVSQWATSPSEGVKVLVAHEKESHA